jgi:hypothetical protein
MVLETALSKLLTFRQGIFLTVFGGVAVLMDLLDAISSNTTASSVVELSLTPQFRRRYGSLYRGISHFLDGSSEVESDQKRLQKEKQWLQVMKEHLPIPQTRKWVLLATDVTPTPRPFASTLSDRSVVYSPNAVLSNKPIAVGHQYSHLVLLPVKTPGQKSPWVVPLSARRVPSQQTGTEVASEQLDTLFKEAILPPGKLCVHVGDTAYSSAKFVHQTARHKDVVQIARVRCDRVFYRTAVLDNAVAGAGHPHWFGEAFDLKNADAWGKPNEQLSVAHTTGNGKTFTVQIQAWHNLLMRGKKKLPMHQHPFTLIRVLWLNADGTPAFKRAMWLIAVGDRRHELSGTEIWQAYAQRYDIEHYFRFGKQRLLMASFQTPEVEHEENWQQLIIMAYVQLFLASSLVQTLPRPWESKIITPEQSSPSPSQVQRDLGRIIRQLGSPADDPKPRGNSKGRAHGKKQNPRKRHPVVLKGKKIKIPKKEDA